jgi:glutathione S-transferase
MTNTNLLYVLPFSLYSNVGVLLLWEKGVQTKYRLQPVDLESGEHNQPDFIRLNPLGKVPVLIHEDLPPTPDSLAIARFLDHDDTLKTHDPAVLALVEQFRQISIKGVKLGEAPPESDEKARRELAKVRDQLVAYQAQYPDLGYDRRLEAYDARTRWLSEPSVYKGMKQTWDDLLDQCERRLGEGAAFLVGDQHSLADIYATAFLFSASSQLKDPLFANRPALYAYYQAQWTRPAVVGAFTR